MKKYEYSNIWGDVFQIYQFNGFWEVWQDGVPSVGKYKTLKAAKTAIDNQEIYF